MSEELCSDLTTAEGINDRLNFARERLRLTIERERASRDQFAPKTKEVENPNETSDKIESDIQRGPGRPKKTFEREKKVVFELRGKPFALKDVSSSTSIYSLGRAWMRGRDDDLSGDAEIEIDYPVPDDDTLELLATKEIYAMPRPRENVEVIPCPEPLKKIAVSDIDINSGEALLRDHLSHWKAVKKSWKDHCAVRDKRYEKSINLLNTVNNIARQGSFTMR